MWWLWLLVLAIVCMILFLISSIRIQLQMNVTEHGQDELKINITALYRLVRWQYVKPITFFKDWKEGTIIKEGQPFGKSFVQAWGKRHPWMELTARVKSIIKKILSRIHCSLMRWHTSLGTKDAAKTAMAVGGLWAIKSMLLRLVFQHVKLEARPDYSIHPMYNLPQFSTEFITKLQIRVGWLVFYGLVLMIRIMQDKKSRRAWKQMRFKPS